MYRSSIVRNDLYVGGGGETVRYTGKGDCEGECGGDCEDDCGGVACGGCVGGMSIDGGGEGDRFDDCMKEHVGERRRYSCRGSSCGFQSTAAMSQVAHLSKSSVTYSRCLWKPAVARAYGVGITCGQREKVASRSS